MARATWLVTGLIVFLSAGAAGVYLSQNASAPPDTGREIQQLVARARRALESNAFTDVVKLARAVPDDSADAADVRLWEGVALWKLDRWQAAEDAWMRALGINPEVPEAGWRLLLVYFYEQRFDEAEQLALKLYPIEPDAGDRTRLLLELIRQDSERVGPEATVMTLEPVLVHEPENFHALRVIGLSYVQLGRTSDGADWIERARRLRPDDLDGWFTWVWYLFETGKMEKLAAAWDEMPAAAREQTRFLRYQGMWAEATGDSAAAERAYRSALEHDPADRKAHYQLARLLRADGKETDAEKHEAEARELDDAREALAAAYLRTTQSNNEVSSQDCREFGRWCRRLWRTRQAELWEKEASRRPAP